MSIKIMLDPGHAGNNYGHGINPAFIESTMNWKLHLFLKTELLKYGFIVGTTKAT